jgi:endonuclease/exonuclease/phosphatase (EEP) superfamily protein YafD
MRALIMLTTILIVTGCATQNELSNVQAATLYESPESCAAQLGSDNLRQYRELDSSDIRIVNWNIQKGGDPEWINDLASFANDPNLMIFQEASQDTGAWDIVASDHSRSFARGYRTPGAAGSVTGVMTLSSAEPWTRCSLISMEPWLRSPKATMITEYGLTNSDQSLLVVNIHAINFALGNKDFQEQIQRAMSVIDVHTGPILLSGDFNTWHQGRTTLLREMTDDLGLTMLNFDEDHRKRAFGLPLDHIYYRGLTVIEATSGTVNSSDHNPMSARMSL